MGYIWAIIAILLGSIEYMTINLITIWWCISAIITFVLSFFIKDFISQFFFFIILGLILLITCKSKFNKIFILDRTKINPDKILGNKGYVIEPINKDKYGKVKINGKRWEAISDEQIKQNELIKVVDVNGIKLKVKKISQKV